jgi:hypothetical protein
VNISTVDGQKQEVTFEKNKIERRRKKTDGVTTKLNCRKEKD